MSKKESQGFFNNFFDGKMVFQIIVWIAIAIWIVAGVKAQVDTNTKMIKKNTDRIEKKSRRFMYESELLFSDSINYNRTKKVLLNS